MKMDIFSLPGPVNFIRGIIRDLLDGRNVFINFPAGFNYENLVEYLKEELRKEERFFIRKSVLSMHEKNVIPSLAIMEEFSIKINGNNPREHINKIITSSSFSGQIILIEGLENINDKIRDKWLEFIRDYATISRQIKNYRKSVFLIPVRGKITEFIPREDVHISHHWWWGVFSKMEIAFLVKSISHEKSLFDLWANTVLLEMSGYDIDFAIFLLNREAENYTDIYESCKIYAEKMNWEDISKVLKSDKHILHHDFTDRFYPRPPSYMTRYWSEGVFNQLKYETPGFHSAILVEAGFLDDIKRRLWRGQMKEVLVVIDKMRMKICRELDKRFRSEWKKWININSQKDGDTIYEIGHLAYLFRNAPELKCVNSKTHKTIELLYYFRNELSHLRPVSREKLLEGIELNLFL